jgi:hypothetical protein
VTTGKTMLANCRNSPQSFSTLVLHKSKNIGTSINVLSCLEEREARPDAPENLTPNPSSPIGQSFHTLIGYSAYLVDVSHEVQAVINGYWIKRQIKYHNERSSRQVLEKLWHISNASSSPPPISPVERVHSGRD